MTESRGRSVDKWQDGPYAHGKGGSQYSCLQWQEEGQESWLSEPEMFFSRQWDVQLGPFSVIHAISYFILSNQVVNSTHSIYLKIEM